MNLLQMKFRNFVWVNNPSELVIRKAKNLRETAVPFGTSKTMSMGELRRRVSGKGYFVGENAREIFVELESEFKKGTGMLQLPNEEPFLAEFEKLTEVNSQGENLIEYSFEFTELETKVESKKEQEYIALGGESLWDIAYRYSADVHRIIELNPQIRKINCLKEGEKVVLI